MSLGVKRYAENFYKSLIEPPAGYSILRSEVVRGAPDDLDREEEDLLRSLDINPDAFPSKMILFRAIIKCPDGMTKYTSSMIDSIVALCKIDFWEDFWEQVLASEKGRRVRRRAS